MVQIYVLGGETAFVSQKKAIFISPLKTQNIAFQSNVINFFLAIQHENKQILIGLDIRSINPT
jgi:hypothetical protein